MACKKECFEATIANCSANILLKAGLTSSTEYYWLIVDRHGNLTQRKATTDTDGLLTIETPAGLNPYSGVLHLSIREGANYLQTVMLTFEAVEYGCVQFTIIEIDREIDDLSKINQIGL